MNGTATKDFADSKPKWGDEEENEDFGKDVQEITDPEPDKDGAYHKTVIEYKTNDKGQKVKVVKKIKMYKTQIKVNKKVEEHQKWRKFGECRDVPPGPESGITSIGEEVSIDYSKKTKSEEKKPVETANLGIVCRNCGKTGDHWTHRCPYKDTLGDRSGKAAPGAAAIGGGDGKYVPPSMRGKGGPGSSELRDRRDETATVRVTNLSEDTRESDLLELFRKFGQISRIFMARDKETNTCKGFAFINYVHREDAALAIEKLNGFGYDHLILHLEWAKPSNH